MVTNGVLRIAGNYVALLPTRKSSISRLGVSQIFWKPRITLLDVFEIIL